MPGFMKLHALLALALICGLLTCRAELPGTAAIVIPEKGLLEKDHEALQMRWAEKHWLPEAEKRWLGKPWADQARAVTLKGLRLWFNGPTESTKEAEKTVAAARELVKTDCDEPVACLMAHKVLWQLTQSWWSGYAGLNKAFKIADDVSYPGALRVWIIDEQIDHLRAVNWRYHGFHLKQVDRIVQALGDGSYSAEFEPVLVRDFLDWMENTKELSEDAFKKLEKAIQDSSHSEWVKECLRGDLHVHWAWFRRGSSWAKDVTEEGWQGLEEHLPLAGKHLKRAHELRPDRPEAAGRVLQVIMGGAGDHDLLRAWFDRAIAAQFDYREAYSGLLYASTKRWGGSDELLLSLGKRFAETQRYDTDVPMQFYFACKQVAMESGDARQVFSSPEVKETALTFARGLLDHPEPNPARAAHQRGLATVIAWLAGDDALATRGLKSTNQVTVPSVSKQLNDLLHHVSTLRTSVYAGNGGWGEEVRQLEHQYRQRDIEGAKKTLAAMKMENLPTDNSRNYVTEIRTVLELPEKLKSGDWQPLPIFPGLVTCFCTGGSWRVSAPGELTLTGKDAAFLDLAFPVLVEENCEIRGEVSYELIPQKLWHTDWSFGPSLLWLPARFASTHSPAAVRGLTFHPTKGTTEARVTGTSNHQMAGNQAIELKPVNTFHVSLKGKELRYTFNDTVLTLPNIEALKLNHNGGLLGFTGINVPTGVKIKVKNLEVRSAP